MEIEGVLFFIVAVAVVSTALVARVVGRRRRMMALRRRLVSFPPARIASAQEGPVAVQGRARARGWRTAPVSGREVIGFRLKVETKNPLQKAPWRTLLDLSEIEPFEVEDSSGRASVEPGDSQLLLELESTKTNGFLTSVPPRVEALLQRHGETCQGWVLEKKLRWSEYLLEPDELVLVCGQARRELAPREEAAGFREAPSRLVLVAPPDGRMIVSDQGRRDLLRSLGLFSDLPPG